MCIGVTGFLIPRGKLLRWVFIIVGAAAASANASPEWFLRGPDRSPERMGEAQIQVDCATAECGDEDFTANFRREDLEEGAGSSRVVADEGDAQPARAF